MRLVGIYDDNDSGVLVHIVETIQEAAEWLRVSPQALYKSLKVSGSMNYRGYTLELVNIDDQEE